LFCCMGCVLTTMPPKKKKPASAAAKNKYDGFDLTGVTSRMGEAERRFAKKLFKKKGPGAIKHSRLHDDAYTHEIHAKYPLYARHKYKNFAQTFRRLSQDFLAEKEARGRRKDLGLQSDGEQSSSAEDGDDDEGKMDVEEDDDEEDDHEGDGGDGLYTRGDDDEKPRE